MSRSRCWVEGRRVCCEMPALVYTGGSDAFQPAWRMRGAVLEGDRVCVRLDGPALLRAGRGRRAGYYVYDGSVLIEARSRRVKLLGVNAWATCIPTLWGWLCFQWRDGRLVRVTQGLS